MPNDNPFIFVVILNWNGKQDTLECLRSVSKMHYSSYQILVVDNGSTDLSCTAIREEFPDVHLLETGNNLGFSGGNNLGIDFALNLGAEAILLLNNDTIVDVNLLQAFAQKMKEEPDAGIYGGALFLFDQPEKLDHLGGIWNKKTARFDLMREFSPKQPDYVCGAALLAKREVFEKIGSLESRFFLIWEESDFCFRAKKHGFRPVVCEEAKVLHKVSASFVGGKPHTNYYWWRNRLFWIERNLPLSQKLAVSFFVLLPEISHLLKLNYLKSLELFLFGFLFSEEKRRQKKLKLIQYRAALCGVKDYCFRRFGNGPAWLLQNRML